MPEEKNEKDEKVEEPKAVPKSESKDVEENKVFAVIAYIWILFLVPLLGKKDSPFAQYHGKQGLALFVLSLILQLGWIIYWIPILGWLVAVVVWIGFFILWIMGIINAASGKMVPLPIIGKYAEKLKI